MSLDQKRLDHPAGFNALERDEHFAAEEWFVERRVGALSAQELIELIGSLQEAASEAETIRRRVRFELRADLALRALEGRNNQPRRRPGPLARVGEVDPVNGA